MTFSNFVKDEPKGNPYLHMNFDAGFAWDTKDDANDQDNGFICKKQHTAMKNDGSKSLNTFDLISLSDFLFDYY